MSTQVEPLLAKHKVNLMLVGHQHSYERSCAAYGGRCVPPGQHGTVHLVVGSAGATLERGGFSPALGNFSMAHVDAWGSEPITQCPQLPVHSAHSAPLRLHSVHRAPLRSLVFARGLQVGLRAPRREREPAARRVCAHGRARRRGPRPGVGCRRAAPVAVRAALRLRPVKVKRVCTEVDAR